MRRTDRSVRVGDRGVSTTVNYILGLSIMFLLTTGLFIAGGDFVDDQRDRAIRSELQVVGQQVANDVARVSRSVEGAGIPPTGTVSVTQQVPGKVAGTTYAIEVESSPTNSRLLLSTENPDITVIVDLVDRPGIDYVNSTLDGGTYRIVYRASLLDPEIEVKQSA